MARKTTVDPFAVPAVQGQPIPRRACRWAGRRSSRSRGGGHASPPPLHRRPTLASLFSPQWGRHFLSAPCLNSGVRCHKDRKGVASCRFADGAFEQKVTEATERVGQQLRGFPITYAARGGSQRAVSRKGVRAQGGSGRDILSAGAAGFQDKKLAFHLWPSRELRPVASAKSGTDPGKDKFGTSAFAGCRLRCLPGGFQKAKWGGRMCLCPGSDGGGRERGHRVLLP